MKVGMVAGNFDIIHMGYIHMFNECSKKSDHLVVFMQDEPSIERNNKLKPIHTINERTIMLSSFSQIDEIVS